MALTVPSLGGPSSGPSSPEYRFTTVDELFNEIDHTTGDILTVYGVSAQDFDEIDREREHCGRAFRLRRFSAKSEILIITIPTKLHEKLHTGIWEEAFLQIFQIGLRNNWNTMGTATFRAQGHPGGDAGEGDSTGGPEDQRGDEGDWPTLVIEAGDSETLEELRNDMRWWFNASNHQVKIVLLAKFDDHQDPNQIILEKWVEVQAPPRQGAVTTRAFTQAAIWLVPDRSQLITIIQNPSITDTDPNRFHPTSYTVTREALRLEFDRLFLRQPGQGQGDIIISVQDLQIYAGKVWRQRRLV
ncbi:hypothetical protein F5Y06DRAFT_300390 [Hypoxylon sp. FL0890]|nr:hypothetical protein F5Y06DRAFT_300390 [Hypoxylon sp. FL0890]